MANMSRKEHFHKALSDMSMEGFLQLVDQIWNAAFTATETLGSFTSVLPNDGFLGRLHLIAIDKLHLCAKDNWSGNFDQGDVTFTSQCRFLRRAINIQAGRAG